LNNKFDGLGTYILTNAEKFIGKFENGKINGEGSFYRENGEIIMGIWINDIF